MLAQVDISDAKQMCVAHAAAEERTRERMQALQRKLLRAVTEAEALRHVMDRLQAQVLALRRQMQVSAAAGATAGRRLSWAAPRCSPHGWGEPGGTAALKPSTKQSNDQAAHLAAW